MGQLTLGEGSGSDPVSTPSPRETIITHRAREATSPSRRSSTAVDDVENKEGGSERDRFGEEDLADGNGVIISSGENRVIKQIKGALLGAGSLGSVYLGMDADTGLLMAVRQVLLSTGNSAERERRKNMLSVLEPEVALLKAFRHEYIVQCLDLSISTFSSST